MDGLSALSVASAAVTFVQFGLEIFSKATEMYDSMTGNTKGHQDIRVSAERLDNLCNDLERSLNVNQQAQGRHEKEIVKIAKECQTVGLELSSALDKLRAQKGDKWSSTLKAIQSMWKDKKILATEKRLERLKDDLSLHLSAAFHSQQSSLIRSLEILSLEHRRLQIQSQDRLHSLRDELLKELQKIREKSLETQDTLAPATEALKDLLSEEVSTDNRPQSELHRAIGKDRHIQNTLSSSGAVLSNLLLEGNRIEKENKFLQSLHFPELYVRRMQITKKHAKTFDWIFESHHKGKRLYFQQWLECEKCPFWIVGKAGSGKSTLIKAIFDDSRVEHALERWSSGKRLVSCAFFFWSAGTELQKSYEGLLRSLLFEIYRQCPDLIPSKFISIPSAYSPPISTSWPIEALMEMVQDLSSHGCCDTRFCFFIDGLDEYCGEDREIADALQTLASSIDFKLCVSSRPRSAFEDTFGVDDRFIITLHEHTEDDIRLYVHEVLEQDSYFQRLKSRDQHYQDIIDKLIAKAQGVFLWIFLVVRELRNKLPNKDSVEELHERINSFPPDLEPFFMRMLDSIDPFYQRASSKVLLMCLAVDVPLPVLTLRFALEIDKSHREQECVEPLTAHITPWSEQKTLEATNEAEERLKNRCIDLVETYNSTEGQIWFSGKCVGFLHRTIYDFLRGKDVLAKIRNRIPGDFNAYEAVSMAALSHLKVFPVRSNLGILSRNFEYLPTVILFCCRKDAARGKWQRAILDESERAMQVLLAASPRLRQNRARDDESSFAMTEDKGPILLPAAISWGLVDYVSIRVQKVPSYAQSIGKCSTLAHALVKANNGSFAPDTSIKYANPQMIDLLLHHGANPNRKRSSNRPADQRPYLTPWAQFLECLTTERPRAEWPDLDKIMISLVQHGADVNLQVQENLQEDGPSVLAGDMVTKMCTPANVDLMRQAVARQKPKKLWFFPFS